VFIDIHVHTMLFPGPKRLGGTTFATPEELRAMLEPHGVRKAVLLPLVSPEAREMLVTVEESLAVVEKHPDFFVPFMNIDPRQLSNSADAELSHLMKYYMERGCKGIGEMTANLPFDDPLMENLFKHAQACKLPITFHISPRQGFSYGIVDHLGLPLLEGALQKFPELTFLGHSQPFWAEISGDLKEEERNGYPQGKVAPGGAVVRLMRKYPNLHGDLSAGSGLNAITRDPEFGYGFLTEFQDRLLFGTDICSPHDEHHQKLIDFLNDGVENGHIAREVYEKITWKNATQLLGL